MHSDIEQQVNYLFMGLNGHEGHAGIINDLTVDLRDHQYDILNKFNGFTASEFAHSYCKLPTGFGKTVTFSLLTRAYLNGAGDNRKKVLIIVPRIALIDQTQNELKRFANLTASEFYGKEKQTDSDVIITTYQSLSKLIENIDIKNIGFVFADEAHHMLGDKTAQLLKKLIEYSPVMGFSATPDYEANKTVAKLLPTELVAIPINDAVKKSILCPVKNILVRSSMVCDLSQAKLDNTGDYDYKSLNNFSPETLTSEVANVYMNGYDEDTGIEFRKCKALINCPNIEIANLQAEKINKLAGKEIAISLNSKTDNFKEYQDKFRNGKYKVACQVGTMTEGFDDVNVSLCMNYPTHSRVKAEQTAGRVLRINPKDKDKFAFVVDMVFQRVANEPIDSMLETAAGVSQILFKDIIHTPIVLPDNYDIKNNKQTSKRQSEQKVSDEQQLEQKTSENIQYGFTRIITKTADLIKLFNEYEENHPSIEQKTSDWLNTRDLTGLIKNGQSKCKEISDGLQKLYNSPKRPDWCKRMQSGNRQPICINKDNVNNFCDWANNQGYDFELLTKENDLPQKDNMWLSTSDLRRLIKKGKSKCTEISDGLQKLYNSPKRPDWCKKMQSGSHQPICINKNNVNDFCDWANNHGYDFELSVKENDLPQKDNKWLNASDLSGLIKYGSLKSKEISDGLQKLYNSQKRPDWCKKMQSGSHQPICINKNNVNDFCDWANNHGYDFELSVKENDLPKKDNNWLNASDLRGLIKNGQSKIKEISDGLQKLYNSPKRPDWCKKMQAGPKQPICIYKDNVNDFLVWTNNHGYDFELLTKEKDLPQKDNKWLNASDLIGLIKNGQSKIKEISDGFQKLYDSAKYPDWCKRMQSGKRQPICIKRGYEAEFCKKAGFEFTDKYWEEVRKIVIINEIQQIMR